MGLFKADAPDPPDYSAIAAANAESAAFAAEVARENLAWSKETYAQDREFQTRIYEEVFRPMSALQVQSAQEDRDRYERVYQPLEQSLVDDAAKLGTREEQQRRAGEAVADVKTAFQAQRDNAERALQGYGVDPSMMRSNALDLGIRTAEAAASAGAANNARTQAENMSRALRSEAINIGRGYPGQVAQSSAIAQQGGSAATQAQLAASQIAGANMNNTNWINSSTNANNAGNGLISGIFGTQANIFNTQQVAKTALNSQMFDMLGSGIGAMAMSDERVKENIKPVGKLDNGLTVYEFNYKGNPQRQIGLIAQEVEKTRPEAVSETPGGLKMLDYDIATDPAGPQNDNQGQRSYAIPHDVMMRKGTEFFDKLVDKTRNPAPKKPQGQRTSATQAPPSTMAPPEAGMLDRKSVV